MKITLKNHLIGTDIGVKFGEVPICIRMGIVIGSVETVLHIIIDESVVLAVELV